MPGAAEKFAGGIAVELLDAVRLARTAGSLLLEHATLTAELAGADWQEEEARLKRLIFTTLLYAILIGLVLLHFSAVAVLAAWDTPYRVHAAVLMLLVWIGCAVAVRLRLKRVAQQGERRFAASRAELGKTLELLRRHL
jgi:uncharacterized membrane protein YqjE